LEIVRDCPGIDDRRLAMQQHRHLVRTMRRNRRLLGEAPRDRAVVQPLMRQRHPYPPAIWAERTRGVGTDEFEELQGHEQFTQSVGWAKRSVPTIASPGRWWAWRKRAFA